MEYNKFLRTLNNIIINSFINDKKDNFTPKLYYYDRYNNGNTGSIKIIPDAIDGEKGDQGEKGDSAHKVWQGQTGNAGKTEADFLKDIKGDKGENFKIDSTVYGELKFDNQEIGIFSWFSAPTDDLARIQKRVAGSFPASIGGELHFFEFPLLYSDEIGTC